MACRQSPDCGHAVNHEGPVLDTVRGVDVIDCEGCQFAHVLPLPLPDQLDALYRDRYYVECKPDYFVHAEADRSWWSMVYAERLDWFESWLPHTSSRALLDVGSGPGYFLAEARKRGWEGIGLEPSEQAYRYSVERLGLTVYQRAFTDDVPFADFDVVQLGEVLEHLPNPIATLQLAFRVLKPGGVLCIIVPNDYSLLQRAVRRTDAAIRDPWWIVPEQHLNYFTVRSLHGLVRRCGFFVGDLTTTFPMELFLLMGLNYVGHDEVGRSAHEMRKRLELALELAGLGDAKRQLYREFARRGIGRDIVLLAKKPEGVAAEVLDTNS